MTAKHIMRTTKRTKPKTKNPSVTTDKPTVPGQSFYRTIGMPVARKTAYDKLKRSVKDRSEGGSNVLNAVDSFMQVAAYFENVPYFSKNEFLIHARNYPSLDPTTTSHLFRQWSECLEGLGKLCRCPSVYDEDNFSWQ